MTLSSLRAAVARWSAWRKANKSKPLKEMPTGYLVTVAAPSAMVVLLMQGDLTKATVALIEQLLPTAPWYVTVALSVWLLAWWSMVGLSALLAMTHGRALGERLFGPQR